MTASLPMYDFPEVQAATAQWWQYIATALSQRGIDAPAALTVPDDLHAHWRDPALVMTQTCGYPLRFSQKHVLRPLTVVTYDAPGCGRGTYASAIVTRENVPAEKFEALAGLRLAANGPDSQSGYNCVRDLVTTVGKPGPFFSEIVWSGGHRGSLELIRTNKADVAAIDPVSLELIRRNAPEEFAGLRIVGFSESVKSLPYACPVGTPDDQVAVLREALHAAMSDPASASCRETLLITAMDNVEVSDYDSIVAMAERSPADPSTCVAFDA